MIKSIIFLFTILLMASNCMAEFNCNSEYCPPNAYPAAYQVNISGLKQYPWCHDDLPPLECDFEYNCISGCEEIDGPTPSGILCPTGAGSYAGDGITLDLYCENGEPKVSIGASGLDCDGWSSGYFDGIGSGIEGSASNTHPFNCATISSHDMWSGTATYTPIWDCGVCECDNDPSKVTVVPETLAYPTEKCCGTPDGETTYTVTLTRAGAGAVKSPDSNGGGDVVKKVTKMPEDCATGGTATFEVTIQKADTCDELKLTVEADFYITATEQWVHESGDVKLVPICGSCCEDCEACPGEAGGI